MNAPQRSADGMALDRLAKAGSDLSKVHHVDFLLNFPTQKAAERAANQLVALAFATKTEHGKTDNDWVVKGSKRMFPVESDLMGLRDKLEAIAASEHGVYVGWRADVVR
ncbi:MAG: hypothetical protein RL030_1374 [Pseudomonadota bacterium]|jgi:hypothetical protein